MFNFGQFTMTKTNFHVEKRITKAKNVSNLIFCRTAFCLALAFLAVAGVRRALDFAAPAWDLNYFYENNNLLTKSATKLTKIV